MDTLPIELRRFWIEDSRSVVLVRLVFMVCVYDRFGEVGPLFIRSLAQVGVGGDATVQVFRLVVFHLGEAVAEAILTVRYLSQDWKNLPICIRPSF